MMFKDPILASLVKACKKQKPYKNKFRVYESGKGGSIHRRVKNVQMNLD